ncbi:MAG TPA: alpha-glucuronidase family glycosyl hydrolase, partial [Flavisolibacter sp.]|nr:alpha-glucuronidase family glycosyl hydrolase [Flavisolibacter sp.]
MPAVFTRLTFAILLLLCHLFSAAENGYELWLRYKKTEDQQLLKQYKRLITSIYFHGTSPTLSIAKDELNQGLKGILGEEIKTSNAIQHGSLLILTKQASQSLKAPLPVDFSLLGKEGFAIQSITLDSKPITTITANTDIGVLYGVFHFLRLLQTNQDIQQLSITESPKIKNRLLNHWDNLNRHVERGYAGLSIWNWHTLPDYIDQRYIDYARANASLGINGTVLTNVNANALVLTKEYLTKVAALANLFRPYGIKVYLTARFSAPMEIGGLKTADPLDTTVQHWWAKKTKEIYELIPDFGGFLVKANSEGQPGPQNYGRTHADGANLLATALAPYNGLVIWRAFVYSNEKPEDRFKQAYNEFQPLDGTFKPNVLVQVKNGPIDFQPREPISPLFGAMKHTPLAMEFQITQEYLGQGTHLVYQAPLFKEVLATNTYRDKEGAMVAKIIDGSLHQYATTAIAGVANIGNDINWTGHPFGQANWYAYGRLAWNHNLSASQIADEWIYQTFSSNRTAHATIRKMMLASYETLVNYMTPLGLHHIMGTGHHYGPAPWVNNAGRDDWNPVYYHKADKKGIGFDRTTTGSNALSQYAPAVKKIFEDINTCPEEFLLWFHHVPWDHKMKSGKSLWEELCYRYYTGVDSMRAIQQQWNSLQGLVDEERFRQVQMLLNIQVKEAVWWRNACLLYFQSFSGMPIPGTYEKPEQT